MRIEELRTISCRVPMRFDKVTDPRLKPVEEVTDRGRERSGQLVRLDEVIDPCRERFEEVADRRPNWIRQSQIRLEVVRTSHRSPDHYSSSPRKPLARNSAA